MPANPLRMPEDPYDNPFDFVIIAGEYLPGLANVGKPKRTWKWDKKEAAGTAGDSLTYRGKRLVEFVIELTFWEADQIDEWDEKRPDLEPDQKNPKALDVTHPVLERQSVFSIVVTEIVELYKENDAWKVQIGVDEYKPPPKTNATGTPNGSTNSNGKAGAGAAAKPTTAKSAQELEIERLLAEASKP